MLAGLSEFYFRKLTRENIADNILHEIKEKEELCEGN